MAKSANSKVQQIYNRLRVKNIKKDQNDNMETIKEEMEPENVDFSDIDINKDE